MIIAAMNKNAGLLRGKEQLALSELPVEAKARYEGFFQQEGCASLSGAHVYLLPLGGGGKLECGVGRAGELRTA